MNKSASVLLLMVCLEMVGGGSASKLSVRGGRCGGVLLGVDFVLGPRRRGDAGSGVVVRSRSLYRSLLSSGFLEDLAWWGSAEGCWCLRLSLWLGPEAATTSRRWLGDLFPTDVLSSFSIPAMPDIPCGASTQISAIKPRLVLAVERLHLLLLRRSLGGVGDWMRRAMWWLSGWIFKGLFVIFFFSRVLFALFPGQVVGMFPDCAYACDLCISFSV